MLINALELSVLGIKNAKMVSVSLLLKLVQDAKSMKSVWMENAWINVKGLSVLRRKNVKTEFAFLFSSLV